MVPRQRDLRISDGDRERVVGWLRSAVSEGRLTLGEFEERVDGVLRAKTYGDVEEYAGSTKSRVPASYDLPGSGTRFVVTGSNKAGSLKVRYQRRFWRWRW